jgi:carboxymethylenebutenolidase
VIEEIFGVHEWIADVCRRLAKLGYMAVAPELYARLGDLSTMTDPGQIMRDVISKAPDDQIMRDLDSSAAWAGKNGGDLDRLGVTGFCRGGRAVWLYGAHGTKLKAAVAWYGPMGGQPSEIQPQSALDVAGAIRAPLLGLYGKEDGSIPQPLLLQAESKAKAAGKTVEIVLYDGAGHAFAADYRPSYRKAAATDGWERMLAWFKRYGVG